MIDIQRSGTDIQRCAPDGLFNSVRLGTLRVGSSSYGSKAQAAQFDLRGATVAGGILAAKSLAMGARGTCVFMLDASTVLDTIVEEWLVTG